MAEDAPQETRRLTEAMARAPLEFRGPSIAVAPPVAVVCTGGAAIIAADGWGWRPIRVRTS